MTGKCGICGKKGDIRQGLLMKPHLATAGEETLPQDMADAGFKILDEKMVLMCSSCRVQHAEEIFYEVPCPYCNNYRSRIYRLGGVDQHVCDQCASPDNKKMIENHPAIMEALKFFRENKPQPVDSAYCRHTKRTVEYAGEGRTISICLVCGCVENYAPVPVTVKLSSVAEQTWSDWAVSKTREAFAQRGPDMPPLPERRNSLLLVPTIDEVYDDLLYRLELQSVSKADNDGSDPGPATHVGAELRNVLQTYLPKVKEAHTTPGEKRLAEGPKKGRIIIIGDD